MSIRRRTAGLVVGLLVVAAPVPAVATADDASEAATGRAALPRAIHDAELPPVSSDAARSRATARSRAPVADPPVPRAAAATGDFSLGASLYVDGCGDSGSDAFDVRRTGIGVETDRSRVLLTLRTCDPDALRDIDGQALVWRTATPQRWTTFEVRRDDGEVGRPLRVFRGDGSKMGGVEPKVVTPVEDVDELQVVVPIDELDLPAGCDPAVAAACMIVDLRSLDGTGSEQDRMPDAGAPTPSWPSACRPDIDPTAAGHVRLTTTSPTAARTVAADLAAAGHRAEAFNDAPYVDVPVGASPEVVAVLSTWDEVAAVTPVTSRRTTAVTPDDPRYDQQWYLDRIDMPVAWEQRTGSGVGIAVVDNGVAADRQELAGRVGTGWDALTDRELAAGTHSDLGGHGTAVAALAAAAGDDGHGIAGVDWEAVVHPVRVFDHEGCFVSEPAYVRALEWVAAEAAAGRIEVVNLSLGGEEIPGEQDAIAEIVDNGATVVAAMGNNGDRIGAAPSFPAALPDVVAVGATGPSDALAGYSNRGRHVDVVAPGGDQSGSTAGDVLTLADPVVTGPNDPYFPLAGTSFSSPLVAGLAALYTAEHPGATPADVARAVVTTAEDLGDELAGFDIGFGFGMIDGPRLLAHEPGQTLVRVAGEDRYETAAAASRRAFPDPSLVDVVLLATGENYPDALAGGPLAAREHAPLLLTPGDRLHDATRDELERLSPERVLVLGGPTAVSDAVVDALDDDHQVQRAAGEDRYATAATIALGSPGATWRAWNDSDVVYLATGENFPDALAGGAVAAGFDAPLLLTARFELPGATRSALVTLDPSRVVVLGGEAAVAESVVDQVEDLGIRVARAAGENRYATAIAAICGDAPPCPRDARFADTRFAVVATGEGFADALGGSAAAAALRAPLVLVPHEGPIPDVVADAMAIVEPEQMVVLGGPIPVPEEMADKVRTLAVR